MDSLETQEESLIKQVKSLESRMRKVSGSCISLNERVRHLEQLLESADSQKLISSLKENERIMKERDKNHHIQHIKNVVIEQVSYVYEDLTLVVVSMLAKSNDWWYERREYTLEQWAELLRRESIPIVDFKTVQRG